MIYPNIRIEMERGGFTVHQLAAILGLPDVYKRQVQYADRCLPGDIRGNHI